MNESDKNIENLIDKMMSESTLESPSIDFTSKIMSQVLVAEKRAQANIITRREETASTRSLLNTAKLMEDNNMLYKLKEMEYVEKIADKIGEISVSGNGTLIEQLKQIFVAQK
jgi:hypothetical protein